MKIGFYEETLSFRGTTRAILSYANALKSRDPAIRVVYLFGKASAGNTASGLLFINCGIEIYQVRSLEDINIYDLDWLYIVTGAELSEDHWVTRITAKTLIHQIGYSLPQEKLGTLFAYASFWQSYHFSLCKTTVLPYIIERPIHKYHIDKATARSRLGIPSDALVLGRHGGQDTWNLPFVSNAVNKAVRSRNDMYFLFYNTPRFADHPNIKFYPGTHDQEEIELFLSACDAMIHARWEGETFGLACAEFLVRNKPIITWAQSRERNHILLAENSLICYNNEEDLLALLSSLTREWIHLKSELVPSSSLLSAYSSKSVSKVLVQMLDSH